MDSDHYENLLLANDLNNSILEGQFQPLYQPIINLLTGQQQPILPHIQDYMIMPGPGTMPVTPEVTELPVTSSESAAPVADSEPYPDPTLE